MIPPPIVPRVIGSPIVRPPRSASVSSFPAPVPVPIPPSPSTLPPLPTAPPPPSPAQSQPSVTFPPPKVPSSSLSPPSTLPRSAMPPPPVPPSASSISPPAAPKPGSPMVEVTSISQSMPPPPPPAQAPVPQPPPELRPLPMPPAISTSLTPTTASVEVNEKDLANWDRKITLITEALLANQRVKRIEDNITVAQAAGLAVVSGVVDQQKAEEQRKTVEQRATKLEEQASAARTTLSEKLNALLTLDGVVGTDLPGGDIDKRIEDMTRYVQGLHSTAADMSTALKNVLKEKDEQRAQDNARKRRRPNEDEPDEDTLKLNQLRLQLEKMEKAIDTFSNIVLQDEQYLVDSIEATLADRLESLKLTHEEAALDDGFKATLNERLSKFEGTVNGLQDNIAFMANHTQIIQAKISEQDGRIVELQQQNAQLSADVASLNEQFKAFQQRRKRRDDEMHALTAALDLWQDQAAPKIPPITADEVVGLIREPIIDEVRGQIQGSVRDVRVDIQEALASKNKEFFVDLWHQVVPIVQMAQVINARINKTPAPGPPS
ncbi:hypothetical protein FISHEDRAFT_56996 [Fistulina hepatica ATCC 64428]|nr:hypothetical protein FISHEDRAFT_56996 [Fistulina hepatica ATCC 64428]